ncbi:MAG: hypothetical protein HQL37_12335 [Alphaproteobacteria bacterium]|nr:hypothetical protein [Alphaproteobacteria bacterium]
MKVYVDWSAAGRQQDPAAVDQRVGDAARLLNEIDPTAANALAAQYEAATGQKLDLSTPAFVLRQADGSRQNRYISSETVQVSGNTASPVPNPVIRGQDKEGSGGYLDSRDHQQRDHLGVDLVAQPGTPVTSAVDGTFQGAFDPYNGQKNSGKFTALRVETDDGKKVDLYYVGKAPDLVAGQRVTAGTTPMGSVQDLSKAYTNAITNHVHVSVMQKTPNGNEIYYDPTPIVFSRQ